MLDDFRENFQTVCLPFPARQAEDFNRIGMRGVKIKPA